MQKCLRYTVTHLLQLYIENLIGKKLSSNENKIAKKEQGDVQKTAKVEIFGMKEVGALDVYDTL